MLTSPTHSILPHGRVYSWREGWNSADMGVMSLLKEPQPKALLVVFILGWGKSEEWEEVQGTESRVGKSAFKFSSSFPHKEA